jgi:pyruvate formate lyase activating enzyme
MKESQFYETTQSGRIKCTLCPRFCQLKPGQKGFCYIRQNIDGKLYSLAYGKPYAVNVDPIEKKPLFHFLPGSKIISIGTAGCNMACKFCQNWDLSKAELNHSRAIDLPPNQVIRMATQYKTQH